MFGIRFKCLAFASRSILVFIIMSKILLLDFSANYLRFIHTPVRKSVEPNANFDCICHVSRINVVRRQA